MRRVVCMCVWRVLISFLRYWRVVPLLLAACLYIEEGRDRPPPPSPPPSDAESGGEMFSDYLLIIFIAMGTALLGEGERRGGNVASLLVRPADRRGRVGFVGESPSLSHLSLSLSHLLIHLPFQASPMSSCTAATSTSASSRISRRRPKKNVTLFFFFFFRLFASLLSYIVL